MPTTIVISDDEEDNIPRPSASQARYENLSAASIQHENGLLSRTTPSTGNKRFQAPWDDLQRVSNPSPRQSNMPTTEKQVAGPHSASAYSVTSFVRLKPASSSSSPISQSPVLGRASLASVEFIDLTEEDNHRGSRMESDERSVVDTALEGYQPSQRQIGSVNTARDTSDVFLRTDTQHSARKLDSPNRTEHLWEERVLTNRPDCLSIGEANKGPDSALGGTGNNSPSVSTGSSQFGRAIPWSSQENAAFASRQIMASPPKMMDSHSRGSSKAKSWNEGTSQDRAMGRGQPIASIEFIESPKDARKGGNPSPLPRSSTRPRLKLKGPKRSSSHQQDLVPAGYASSQTKPMRSPHMNQPDTNLGCRSKELDQNRTPRIPSPEVGETSNSTSDSDDASVRMRRSINLASAKYNKDPQVNPTPSEKLLVEEGTGCVPQKIKKTHIPTRRPLKPAQALGSPELGECFPAADDMGDMNLVPGSPSATVQDASDLAPRLEPLSAFEDVQGGPEVPCSSSLPQRMPKETPSEEVAAADELQPSASGQRLIVREPSNSNQHGGISPDMKLLEAMFKPMVKEMRADQEYIMAGFLSRARKDVTQFPGPKLDQTLPDPFAAAATVLNRHSSPFNQLRRVRMESRLVNARKKAPRIESQAVAFKSEAQRLPRYNSIVRLGMNLLAQNDRDLRYVPYFSWEEARDEPEAANHERRKELLEGFGNRIKVLPEVRKCAEQADFWREYTEYFLEEVGCTCVDVMFYLLHDEDAGWKPKCQLSSEALSEWQQRETCCSACGTRFEGNDWDRLSLTLSGQKPDEHTLALAGLVCSVFSKMAKFSIWHIVSVDAEVQSLREKTEKAWETKQERKGSRTQSLCMLCHVFDCPSHGAYLEDDRRSSSSTGEYSHQGETDEDSSSDSSKEVEAGRNIRQIVALPERPHPEGQQHRCGFFCVDPQSRTVDVLGLHENGEVRGIYNMNRNKESGDPGYTNDETCSESCFWDISHRSERTIADIVQSEPSKRFVDWSQRDIKLYKSMLATCLEIRRGPCIMAITLAQPCSVIFDDMLLDTHLIPHPVSEIETNQAQPSSTPLTFAYKDKDYWLKSSRTYDHHKRRPFVPCSHSGPCHKTSNCTCWKAACEWICGCDRTCFHRFQGCRCIARGAKVCFKDSNCDCWVLNRECDPWLCGNCGVLEVLDPLNRHDGSILKGRCKNAMIQRNIPQRTLKGPSEVHAWGLFAGTDIRANEFIGEYKGEVLSEEESNRRGLVYHYRGLEYLFRLNKEQEIDSSRAGNKMRFINNSNRPRTINVYPQTMLCSGVQRIGLFAKRNLVAGEEMFFNYGYPESITKNFWEKGDPEVEKRFSSGDDDDEAESGRLKAKGVKTSVVAAKGKSMDGASRQKAVKQSGGKERHAHFLDDTLDDNPAASPSQTISQSWSRPKKRKRTPSSPVIEETTFHLPEDHYNYDTSPSDPEAPAGPSSSSFGARTEIVESDRDDEDYEEDEADNPSTDGDSASRSEVESYDSDDHHLLAPVSRSIPRRQNKGRLQAAAAKAASLEKRRQANAKKDLAGSGASTAPPTPAAASSGGGAAGAAAPSTSSPKSSR